MPLSLTLQPHLKPLILSQGPDPSWDTDLEQNWPPQINTSGSNVDEAVEPEQAESLLGLSDDEREADPSYSSQGDAVARTGSLLSDGDFDFVPVIDSLMIDSSTNAIAQPMLYSQGAQITNLTALSTAWAPHLAASFSCQPISEYGPELNLEESSLMLSDEEMS